MPSRPEIFISATTKDLGSCRQLVRDCILDLGCHPVVQKHFEPDTRTVRAMLRAQLTPCNAVVHIAGLYYGAEPDERQPGEARRSYTQLEYDMAVEMGKPVYLFICGKDFPYDTDQPEGDPAKEELQRLHREALLGVKQIRYRVSDSEELKTAILKLKDRVNLLIAESEKAKRRQLIGIWMIAALLVLVAGAFWVVKHGVNEVKAGVDTVGVNVLGVGNKVDAVQDGITGLDTTLKAPGAGNGRLLVQSDRPGALAFRHGQRGVPLPLRMELPTGTYNFTFFATGHEPEFRDLTLQSGKINDLGMIRFKPSAQPPDPSATVTLGSLLRNPIPALDREFWVLAEVQGKEISGSLNFLTPAETAHYRHYLLFPHLSEEPNYAAGWAAARLPVEKTVAFLDELRAQSAKILAREKAREKAYLGKYGELPTTSLYEELNCCVQIRIDSRSFVQGGPDPKLSKLKFICEVLAWDFARSDADYDKRAADDLTRGR